MMKIGPFICRFSYETKEERHSAIYTWNAGYSCFEDLPEPGEILNMSDLGYVPIELRYRLQVVKIEAEININDVDEDGFVPLVTIHLESTS